MSLGECGLRYQDDSHGVVRGSHHRMRRRWRRKGKVEKKEMRKRVRRKKKYEKERKRVGGNEKKTVRRTGRGGGRACTIGSFANH